MTENDASNLHPSKASKTIKRRRKCLQLLIGARSRAYLLWCGAAPRLPRKRFHFRQFLKALPLRRRGSDMDWTWTDEGATGVQKAIILAIRRAARSTKKLPSLDLKSHPLITQRFLCNRNRTARKRSRTEIPAETRTRTFD